MTAVELSTQTRERVKITVSGDVMSATVLLFPPQEGESPPTINEIKSAIEKAGIVFGIKDEVIESTLAEEKYNKPIVIAEGVKPKKGENSEFEFLFDTSNNHVPSEDDDGRIDYRNINFIRNVEKGAALVKKIPATPCVPGRTIKNKELMAPAGRDIPFNKGVNTEISEDGSTLIASASGAIMFQHGKVSVNDLTIIRGDVDHQTGNIECLGSVKVTGNIKAGYSLKIDGDLEVGGHVEDAVIEVKGNISVKGGFFGKGDGIMKAGGDITLKYAEGQKLISGGTINVGGEVINCDILAKNAVQFKGSKGKIIGGETKAGKLISACTIGSEAGTITKLYVAFDSALMRQHADVQAELNRLIADKARVKDALYSLYRLELAGKLSPEKKAVVDQLVQFQEELPANLESLENQKTEIVAKLREYDDSKVLAEKVLHAGVTVYFGIVYKDIVDDYEACELIIQDGKIMMNHLLHK